MDWEFALWRKVSGVGHFYEGAAEIRQNVDTRWKWEVGTVMVKRKIGRGVHLVTADPELTKWIGRYLLVQQGAKITSAWRHCQEGGNTPREFSEYVRSVV